MCLSLSGRKHLSANKYLIPHCGSSWRLFNNIPLMEILRQRLSKGTVEGFDCSSSSLKPSNTLYAAGTFFASASCNDRMFWEDNRVQKFTVQTKMSFHSQRLCINRWVFSPSVQCCNTGLGFLRKQGLWREDESNTIWYLSSRNCALLRPNIFLISGKYIYIYLYIYCYY